MNYLNKLLIVVLCLCLGLAGRAEDTYLDDIEIDGNIYRLNDTQKTAALTRWCKSKTSPVIIPSTVVYQNQSYTVDVVGEAALQGCRSEYLSVPPTIRLFELAACGETKFEEVRITDLSAWCNVFFRDHSANPCAGVAINDDGNALLVCNGEPIYDLVVPDDVLRIPSYMFYCNSHIRSVTTTSVEEIGDMAFAGCGSFTYANIGSAIKYIGNVALGTKNSAPLFVNFYSPTLPYIFADSYRDTRGIPKSTRINYPPRFANYWAYDSYYSPESFDADHDNTEQWFAEKEPDIRFVDVDGLLYRVDIKKGEAKAACISKDADQLHLCASVECEGVSYPVTIDCFMNKKAGNSNVTTLKIDSPIEVVPDYICWNFPNLETVELPATVREIGTSAFFLCRKLKNVPVPANLRRIGDRAFEACYSLAEFKVPEDQPLEYVGAAAFQYTALSKIEMNLSGAEIGSGAFSGCENLEEITLDLRGAKSVGGGLFGNCPNLKRVNLNLLGVPFVGSLFGECKNLEDLTLTAEIIPTRTLSDCLKLKRITLGEGTVEVEKSAFFGCRNVTDIYLPSTMRNFHVAPFRRILAIDGLEPQLGSINVHAKDLDSFLKIRPLNFPILDISYSTNYHGGLFGAGGNLYFGDELVEEIVIPHGVSVTAELFAGCGSLKKVVIGDVTAPAEEPNPDYFVGDFAFAFCSHLKELEIAAHRLSPAAYHNDELDKLSFGNTPVDLIEAPQELFELAGAVEVHIPAGKFQNEIPMWDVERLYLGENVTEYMATSRTPAKEVYLYRYAPDRTMLSEIFVYDANKAGSPATYHVPKGCIGDVPEGAQYTGGYNYIDKYWKGYGSVTIIDDLPNPLYAGVEDVLADEESAHDPVTVYAVSGQVCYEGLRGDMNLAPGLYIVKSAAGVRKLRINR